MTCCMVTQAEIEAMQTHVDATKGITERMTLLGARICVPAHSHPCCTDYIKLGPQRRNAKL